MPEIIERAGTQIHGRPETRPRREIEIIDLPDTGEDGIRLHIRWDLKPVQARDIHSLFAGLETLLNQAARAFLSTEDSGRQILEIVGSTEPLIDIEVEELSLGSLKATLRLAAKLNIADKLGKSGKALAERLKDMAIDRVLEEAVKKAAHWIVMAIGISNLGFGEAKPDIGAAHLPAPLVQQELTHAKDFLRDIGRTDFKSTFYIGENVRGTNATVDLPLPPEKP
jgi:hypothetical protein